MGTLEDENQVLREKNTELVHKVQHWKMLAAQRDSEKLDLMKELNELRLSLARLRNNGNLEASKLDTALQSASEKALAHLVRASSEIAHTMDLAKAYMRERMDVDTEAPRWSAIGGTPKTDKIHRVRPIMMGGQFLQPIVALRRADTMLNTSNPRPVARSPSQNTFVNERAVPIRMLQDVYIPLTRVDAGDLQNNNMAMEAEANSDSSEDLGLDDIADNSNSLEETPHISEDYNSPRTLNIVPEDLEPENDVETPPRNGPSENPLEGPSWLLDLPRTNSKTCVPQSRRNLEPDSTTEVEEVAHTTPVSGNRDEEAENVRACTPRTPCVFSPTVRRRKRTTSPPAVTPRRQSQYSPRPAHSRRNSNNVRILKVVVAKMRLDTISPAAKRTATEASLGLLDAPSPNGATVAGVIVSEAAQNMLDVKASGDHVTRRRRNQQPSQDSPEAPSQDTRDTRAASGSGQAARVKQEHDSDSCTMNESEQDGNSRVKQERSSRDNRSRRRDLSSRHGSQDSDSGSSADLHSEGRSRRTRNKVSYQEKPLNRKMRR